MFTESYFIRQPNHDRYERLLREAEHYRLLSQVVQSNPGSWQLFLFVVGDLLIGLGAWLQRHRREPAVAHSNLIEV